MSPAQEIRAQAVRTVVLGATHIGVKNRKEFWLSVQSVADYIRTGSHPEETEAQKRARERQANTGGSSV
jgi:hypothetical protein